MKAKIPAKARDAVTATGTRPGARFAWDGLLWGRGDTVVDFYSGKGAPTATYPDPQPRQGAFYFRKDGGGAGATHIYYFNAAAWIGIA